MTPDLLHARAVTRRHFFQTSGLGFGALALNSLMADDLKRPMIPARAKRVIYLHMAGSPSQLEMFDYKPELQKLHLKDAPASFLEGKRFAFIKGVPKVLAAQFKFAQQGQSGQWMSELMPQLAKVIDKISVIRTVHTDQFNHAPAQLFVHTGSPRLGSPSIGSWATYGLGSTNEDLPGFVVLLSGGKTPDAGKSLWGSGFLPSVYQGVQCRTTGDPVLYLSDPKGMDRVMRRRMLDAVAKMNEAEHARSGDAETLTRIAQYELAYRMQTSVPDVMDISKEPEHVLKLYGAKPGYVSPAETSTDDVRVLYKGDDPTFANNCLLARRLIENGVRFVQLYDWGWDHHGSSPGESIDETLPIKCQQIDRAISGLILDLEQRGLLDDTLIVWGGEFGRTPMMQNNVRSDLKKGFVGRDHHPYAYTMWMAGGGIKGGVALGQTDEFGYYPVENPVGIRDLQATILHQLGLDPYRFHFSYQGLDNRLIGPTNEGKVLKALLA
ncbi:MAG: DUF1501 domain-containing protein [Prosthecobacter sp.]|uniref:DUF1501 domain-containing protein n=1 Tax=Prosthecobacter sp. TaxID=1965333 RepID=UPI0019F821DC|nr:DUF1501 domain-containing protein [Prosthecobacter sp.]MBE2284881.1 DUF1501 domain-containing protein [Prosthecobacter sp.]